MPKRIGASGVIKSDTRVTATAAPKIGRLRLKFERLSVEEIPHIIIKAKANAGLIKLKNQNIFCAVESPNIKPRVYIAW